MTPLVSVLVPTRNRCKTIVQLLDALEAQSGAPTFEVIVIDDGSTDDTWTVLTAYQTSHPWLRPVRSAAHVGPAAARNLGIATARGRLVAFTDDDCLPDPDWIEALVAAHEAGADVVQGWTSPGVVAYGEVSAFAHQVKVTEFDYRFETCNLSYHRDVLEALGGFDPAFGRSRGGAPFGEDADLGWRALEAGYTCVFAEAAIVVHPLTTPPYFKVLTARLRRQRFVYFIRRHPDYRSKMPRRWLYTPSHPPALVALVGPIAVLATWKFWLIPLVVLTSIPYVHHRLFVQRVWGRRRAWPLAITGWWLADVFEIGVLLFGSIRWRTFAI